MRRGGATRVICGWSTVHADRSAPRVAGRDHCAARVERRADRAALDDQLAVGGELPDAVGPCALDRRKRTSIGARGSFGTEVGCVEEWAIALLDAEVATRRNVEKRKERLRRRSGSVRERHVSRSRLAAVDVAGGDASIDGRASSVLPRRDAGVLATIVRRSTRGDQSRRQHPVSPHEFIVDRPLPLVCGNVREQSTRAFPRATPEAS